MTHISNQHHCAGYVDPAGVLRRDILQQFGMGFGGIVLAGLHQQQWVVFPMSIERRLTPGEQ